MTFHFNERELKRLMQTEFQAGIDKMAADQTRDLDRLRLQYTGKPVAEIKSALQRLFAGYGGNVTDPELTEWAQIISDGTRITVQPGKVRL